jgi:hypothetical protein
VLDSDCTLQPPCDDGTIDFIEIADEIFGASSQGNASVICRPFNRGVGGRVDPDQVSAIETDNDEGIKQTKADGGNIAAISTV